MIALLRRFWVFLFLIRRTRQPCRLSCTSGLEVLFSRDIEIGRGRILSLLLELTNRLSKQRLSIEQKPVGTLSPTSLVRGQTLHFESLEAIDSEEMLSDSILVIHRNRSNEGLVSAEHRPINLFGVDTPHSNKVGGCGIFVFPLGEDICVVPLVSLWIISVSQTPPYQLIGFLVSAMKHYDPQDVVVGELFGRGRRGWVVNQKLGDLLLLKIYQIRSFQHRIKIIRIQLRRVCR
mmetsp:Transcript_10382/g.16418  ORF Transcript_10382/g.16418 Transcript_10382/m.16418 type:complete len:234 (+) Transcript_10382:128-829(+)